MGELFEVSKEDALGMMDNVYWTNHGDNVNLLGLDSSYKGQKGQDLYEKMSKKFKETGDSETLATSWRSAISTVAIQDASATLTGTEFGAEKPKVFASDAADVTATAISSKPVSINFETG